jgi:hypothetical protein
MGFTLPRDFSLPTGGHLLGAQSSHELGCRPAEHIDSCPSESTPWEDRLDSFESATPFEVCHLVNSSQVFAISAFLGYPSGHVRRCRPR